jgi:hypothetical protein
MNTLINLQGQLNQDTFGTTSGLLLSCHYVWQLHVTKWPEVVPTAVTDSLLCNLTLQYSKCHTEAARCEKWEASASTPPSDSRILTDAQFCESSRLLWCQPRPPDVEGHCESNSNIPGQLPASQKGLQLWSHEARYSLNMTWHNKCSSYNFQKEKRLSNANMHSSWQFTQSITSSKCDCLHSWTHIWAVTESISNMSPPLTIATTSYELFPVL